jgi:hypothetical protein
VERADQRRVGDREREPARHRRDRLVDVHDVEPPGAQLAPQRRGRERRQREVRDSAVERQADRAAERDQLGGRAGGVAVVRRQHAHVVACGQQFRGQRLDVARDAPGVRPRIRRDEGDTHMHTLSSACGGEMGSSVVRNR